MYMYFYIHIYFVGFLDCGSVTDDDVPELAQAELTHLWIYLILCLLRLYLRLFLIK